MVKSPETPKTSAYSPLSCPTSLKNSLVINKRTQNNAELMTGCLCFLVLMKRSFAKDKQTKNQPKLPKSPNTYSPPPSQYQLYSPPTGKNISRYLFPHIFPLENLSDFVLTEVGINLNPRACSQWICCSAKKHRP